MRKTYLHVINLSYSSRIDQEMLQQRKKQEADQPTSRIRQTGCQRQFSFDQEVITRKQNANNKRRDREILMF